MKRHEVRGGGGLRLEVREWGDEGGPAILFVHGWSQCHLYWSKQYASDLAEDFRLVACDLRGHGGSEAPTDPEHYTRSGPWADDVDAIVGALGLERPVLVAHSYAGVVVCDYLRAHGSDGIGAVNLVGAVTVLGEEAVETVIGPDFLDHFEGATSADLLSNIQAVRAFLRALPAESLSREELETALGWNMVVSPRVRGHLMAREVDSDDVLASLELPVLVSHGRADRAVLPAMAEHVRQVCPGAEVSWYDGVGHLPNLEQPERFNRELRDLASSVPG